MTNITDFSVRRMIATSPLLGERLNLVGPDSGGVDHDVTADTADGAVLGVTHPHADHPIAVAQHRHHLR
jgi:hypothetical protein